MRGVFTVLAVGALALLAGCAATPSDPEERAEAAAVNDPLEPTNRAVYDFNNYLDRNLMEPVAQAYHDSAPDWLRKGVHNVLTNLREPFVAGNDLLQGDTKASADALGRFFINSTFGVLGADDATADSGGAKAHENDLGKTLAVWGVDEGPYLVLPLIGPTTLRDGTGRAAEMFADPTSAVFAAQGLAAINYTRLGGDTLDTRTAFLEPMRDIRRNSIDEYAAVRSLFRQHRRSVIANGGSEEPTPLDNPSGGGAKAAPTGDSYINLIDKPAK